MHRFDVKNPNGSLVFVRGLRVKPFANFTTHLDPMTIIELKRFGVSVTQIGAAPVEAVEAAPDTNEYRRNKKNRR